MEAEIKLNHIYQGDVLETLKGFPIESVDCIVTSPPYWGLRDYGKETYKIWDGRSDCEHEFEVIETKRPNASGGKTDYAKQKLAIKGNNNYSEFVDYHKRVTTSSFCKKCSAWYGQLGLEPSLKLYLEHMLSITQELKRVLKPSGVMFWNHSDSYANIDTKMVDYSIEDNWLKLLGWIWTDGSVQRNGNYICIYQSKVANLEDIKDILNSLNLRFSIYGPNKNNYTFGLKAEDSRKVAQKLCLTSEKNLPPWLSFCSKKQIKVLLESIIAGDGTKRKYDSAVYGERDNLKQLSELLTSKNISHSLDKNSRNDPYLQISQELWNPHYLRAKCLSLQNYRLIFKMIDEQGWILRNTIIWHKPNHMPSSVRDRFSNAYEPVFMFVKKSRPQYYYNTKTGSMADRKPNDLKQGVDWDWQDCLNCEGTGKTIEDIEALSKEGDEYIEQEQGEKCKRCKATGKIKISYWRSLAYWFDLDAVRKPIAEATKKRAKTPFYPEHWKAKVWRKTQKRGGRDAQTFNKEVYAKIANGEKTMANPGDLWQHDLSYVEIPEDLFQEINRFTDAHPEIDYGWFTDLIREIMFRQYIPKDLWTISTQPCPQAHFATFPEKLIEPMIKAGCPQEICKSCGKARVRISKVEGESTTEKIKRLGASGKRGEFERKQALDYAGGHGSNIRPRETIGFTNCSCNVEGNKWKAGIVLDPFMGAGTTGLAAKKLGRNFIGIELNPKYVKMARERIKNILL